MSDALNSLHLLMVETASIDTLYHTTDASYGLKIIKENAFRMPLAETNASEIRGQKKLPGLYYLSTARNLNSGYISDRASGLGVVNHPVTLVLNTRKILNKNRGAKVVPFDYWGMDKHGRSMGSGREAEERIYSNKRILNIKGCYSVIIMLRSEKWERLWQLREVYSYCLKNKIPVKLFTWENLSGFRAQREKPEDKAKAIELLKTAKREHGYQTSHKGILPSSSKTAEKHWQKNTPEKDKRVSEYMMLYHLVTKNDYRDLPEKVKSRFFWYSGDSIHKRMENYLHNLRSTSAQGSDELDKLDALFKRMKAKSVRDFFDKLEVKWERLQKENSEREQREWKEQREAQGLSTKSVWDD